MESVIDGELLTEPWEKVKNTAKRLFGYMEREHLKFCLPDVTPARRNVQMMWVRLGWLARPAVRCNHVVSGTYYTTPEHSVSRLSYYIVWRLNCFIERGLEDLSTSVSVAMG